MTARILGEMSGTLLAMFWTWRNLNEFSTMTVKEVAKVLTQGNRDRHCCRYCVNNTLQYFFSTFEW